MAYSQFYPQAAFGPEFDLNTRITLLDAAIRLLGCTKLEDLSTYAARHTDEKTSDDFRKALHDLEVAVGLGELKAVVVRTYSMSKTAEWLKEVAEGAAPSSEIVINPLSFTFVEPSALLKWWQKRNTQSCESATSTSPMPVQRRISQELAILATLSELGFDPLRLPTTPAGSTSIAKQRARAKLNLSRAVFDKAWQRLRDDGRLAER